MGIKSGGVFAARYYNYETILCLQEGDYVFSITDFGDKDYVHTIKTGDHSSGDGFTACYDDNICGYYVKQNDKIIINSNGSSHFSEKQHEFRIYSVAYFPSYSPISFIALVISTGLMLK